MAAKTILHNKSKRKEGSYLVYVISGVFRERISELWLF